MERALRKERKGQVKPLSDVICAISYGPGRIVVGFVWVLCCFCLHVCIRCLMRCLAGDWLREKASLCLRSTSSSPPMAYLTAAAAAERHLTRPLFES